MKTTPLNENLPITIASISLQPESQKMTGKKGMGRLARQEALAGYLLIAPNLLIYMVFVVIPVLMSLVLSFTDWNFVGGFEKLKFVGLKNFMALPTIPGSPIRCATICSTPWWCRSRWRLGCCLP